MRALLLISFALATSGCDATVLGSNPEGIWFREPFIGDGNTARLAAEHCARFGKTAVDRGTLDPARGMALPVDAWDCR